MIYNSASTGGMKSIGGQTEGFLEGIEPQITELLSALGCDPSDEEEEISIDELFEAFPAGVYTFKGKSQGARFEDQATLSHAIPAGAEITAPIGNPGSRRTASHRLEPGDRGDPDDPDLGPVNIVGYHVVVVEGGGEALPQLDVDVPATIRA